MNPRGKTAIITGGARRVGKAITLGLAGVGVNVIVNYNASAESAQDTVEEARSLGVGAISVQANIASCAQVQSMVDATMERFGTVDILVNSASSFKKTGFPTNNPEDWRTITDILIHGAFHCANTVAPFMLKQGAGVMVNIVDMLAMYPRPGYMAHSVGKAALLALTRQLAVDLAPQVRVNAVCPGPVLPPEHYSDQANARIAKRTLMQQWGTPNDVSRAVIFLVESDYITAETIFVDGGERFGSKL